MRQYLNKIIIIFLCIFAFFWGIVPFVFNKTVPIICENLSYNTSYNITIENPKLYLNLIPTAVIKADKVNISSKLNEDMYQICDLNLKIRVLPLLTGRIHINKIKSSKVNVYTLLRKNVVLDKNFISNLRNAKVYCDYIDIENVNIKIHQLDKKQNAVFVAKQIYYKKTGRFIKVNIDSRLEVNNTVSISEIEVFLPKNNNAKRTLIKVNISNFDVSPIAEYFKNYLPPELIKAEGVLDIKADNTNLFALFKHFKIIMKDAANSMIFPDELRLSSGMNLSRKTISIDNAELISKNISAIINGTISDYLDKPFPEININIRINKSKIEDFISMLPSFKTEDIDAYKLKKYKFYGDILGNITIKGNNPEPNVTGSIYIDNGVLTTPIPNAKGATVKLDFKGKYLNFDVAVPAGFREKVWIKGGVELYNVKYADMRVWSTQNVDLAVAESKVVPIHEILNFVIGPVPIMDIKGNGNIDIIIKGNRKNPHVWGDLIFNNAATYFYEIPNFILTNADTVLTFEDENAVFKLKRGLVNGRDISIDGVCNVAGKFDFDVKTDKQNLADLYNAIKTSTMIDAIKMMIPPLENVRGLANLKLKVYGSIKDIYLAKFNENFFVKGVLELMGNSIEIQGVKLQAVLGNINFDNTNADIAIKALAGRSPIELKALIKDKYTDAYVNIPRLNLKDVIPRDEIFRRDIADIYISLVAKYKGSINKIEYDKLDFTAQILEVARTNKLKLSKGFVSLKNGRLVIKDINGSFADSKSSFNINLQALNLPSNPMFSGSVKLKDFELNILNTLHEYVVIPENVRSLIKTVQFKKGKINLEAKILNNNINASTNIGGVEYYYTPLKMPIKVVNGSLYIRKNYLGLNKINLIADDMPVLVDGGINNIFANQDFNLYINSKPNQNFIDNYINNNRIYPIKIRGDIVYWTKVKGTKDDFDIEAQANLAKDSSMYYLGATIGDVENAIALNLDMNVLKQNILKIKEFSYDKLIESQGKRTTRLNMLKANGGIDILKEDLLFRDLRIKTSHPTDARIFNILFKKPNIKQGQFTSDLRFNGKLSNPHLLGTFHIVETNIPFFDTTMKNLSFVFKDKTIELYSKGEVFGNDVIFKGTLKNKLTLPYRIENAEVYTKILDINDITNKVKNSLVNESNAFDFASVDVRNTVIQNLRIKADEVRLRNLLAENVDAKISLSDKKVFNINNFGMNIANGTLNGSFVYNMQNDIMGITLKANDINANDMAIALFDLDNQLYGNLTGNVKLSCNGSEYEKCMETLNGDLDFNVSDGRMPKLGSLEYLLKAGNLLKGGFTGLSINSVIDILTPLKTGNFSNIYGKLSIKDGISNNVEISTKGEDLSLFITGKYDFYQSDAEMEVLGLLSKKISTMFGPLGNVSLNTLFNVVPGIDLTKDSDILDKINKIPGIELNNKAFRKFIAEIDGNINGDDYVKSFKWIN